MHKLVFRLFACCIPVRGARRSLICDLQRNIFRFIPNALQEILTEHRDKSLEEILALYDLKFHETVREYFEFLEGNDFGFWTDEPNNFPPLELTWERPERITNSIIDFDDESKHTLDCILRQLNELGCKSLQIRRFGTTTPLDLAQILDSLTQAGRLRYVDLIFKFDASISPEYLDQLCVRNRRITQIIVFSAPEDRRLQLTNSGTSLLLRRDAILDHEHCGQIHPQYFSPTYECFLESQSYNTCLNRKISVDARGEIRNCPSMPKTYGNADSDLLSTALSTAGFTDPWAIKKDHIHICRDCEFRYICSDCRAFIQDPDDCLSKPAKCAYDPYTAKWTDARIK